MAEVFNILYDYDHYSSPPTATFKVTNTGLTSGLFTTTLDIVFSNFTGGSTKSESRNLFQSPSFTHTV